MEKMEEDPDSSGQSNFQDLIEMVAAANEHVTDYTNPSELPELRTSPCHFHSRQHTHHPSRLSPQRNSKHQQYLYASNFHAGGYSPRSTTSKRSGGSNDQNKEASLEKRIQAERSKLFQQDLQNGQSQIYSKPVLPQAMTSKDFIKSWLQHGSQPSGHFPEVITPTKSVNHSNNNNNNTLVPYRPAHSNNNIHDNNSNNNNNISMSNHNNRQILAPISQTVKNKRQRK